MHGKRTYFAISTQFEYFLITMERVKMSQSDQLVRKGGANNSERIEAEVDHCNSGGDVAGVVCW